MAQAKIFHEYVTMKLADRNATRLAIKEFLQRMRNAFKGMRITLDGQHLTFDCYRCGRTIGSKGVRTIQFGVSVYVSEGRFAEERLNLPHDSRYQVAKEGGKTAPIKGVYPTLLGAFGTDLIVTLEKTLLELYNNYEIKP